MKTYQDLVFTALQESDIETLTPIMKRAFDEDTRIHLGKPCGGPPGYDNGEFLRRFALDPASTAYTISYPNTKVWQTETPIFSHRNHNFYVNKCGFHIIKIENPKDLNEGMFILEKIMN